jgi:hypothetical protein
MICAADMRVLFGTCVLLIATSVMFSPFVKNEYTDFFGYLTNSMLYFVHLPLFTIVLLAYRRTPSSVLYCFPNCAAIAVGVWLGVQYILLFQESSGTLHLLTQGGAVNPGVGVVGNEIMHTLPVMLYGWIAFMEHDRLCSLEHKTGMIDVLTPLLIASVFFTLNDKIDDFYKVTNTHVVIGASVVAVSTCITSVMIKKYFTI